MGFDGIPTIFPNLPNYLTKNLPQPRKRVTTQVSIDFANDVSAAASSSSIVTSSLSVESVEATVEVNCISLHIKSPAAYKMLRQLECCNWTTGVLPSIKSLPTD